jgi:hypothetical protein
MLSTDRPRPSMLILLLASCRQEGKACAVNWAPRSAHVLGHLEVAIKRRLSVLEIDQTQQEQVEWRLRRRLTIVGRPVQLDQLALASNADLRQRNLDYRASRLNCNGQLFQPLKVHLQSPDLLVQFCFLSFPLLPGPATDVHRWAFLQQQLLPLADLIRGARCDRWRAV